MKVLVWRIGAALCALGSPALGQTLDGRIQAPGLVPAYIKADPAAVMKAFGKPLADKIFSDAYTSVRRQAIGRSVKSVPGYQCSSDPKMVLKDVDPAATQGNTVSWVEQFALMCEPHTQRNFFIILNGDNVRAIEMLPGTRAADPLLLHDAMPSAMLVLNTASPKECQHPVATDSKIIGPAPTGGKPWRERWTFDACGKKAEVDINFTPSPNGGTDWAASLVK
ncbi:MAG: hypothetical protein JO230_00510 [Xanthobacteraceae bacterium]|nr:hypothetical protein [Xanthobacteraceae bacterium]